MLLILLLAAFAGAITWGAASVVMPGASFAGPIPSPSDETRPVSRALRAHVTAIATKEHNVRHDAALQTAADYIESQFTETGLQPKRQAYVVDGKRVSNVFASLEGTSQPGQVVVVGAHYDSALGSPGADDNGTGTAALLELARRLASKPQARTLLFVAFVNEEMPYFYGPDMGSLVFARQLKADNTNVVAMLSLEAMGYYDDSAGSQAYPFPFGLLYPSEGNFIGFVGNLDSRPLVRHAVEVFREHGRIPSEGAALPGSVPGIGWSDHWAFWQFGWPAIMVTDTAPFRNPNYHTPQDTPDTIDYHRLALVVAGMEKVVIDLASNGHEN